MQASAHKKLIYGAFGCGGLLVLLMAASVLMVRRTGLESPPAELRLAPVPASAALDSLSSYDLGALFAPPDAPFPLATSGAPMIARWRPDRTRIAIEFFDTAPPDSWRGRSWREAGAAVAIESLPAGAAPPDSQPIGRAILAAARVLLESGDPVRARDAVALALRRARAFETRADLVEVVSGLRLERDALEMLARDSLLAGGAAVRARADTSLGVVERRLSGVRSLRRLIATAGVSPAAVRTLAVWARDTTAPLAIRDEMIRAVGFGWVFDPQEVTYGIDTARGAAIRDLARAAWPAGLKETLKEATLGRLTMVERLRLSISYRANRMVDL